ncbi:PAAR-like domain-containing protein [Shimia sagamensis]|uniref:GHH signature containing HNH/Endo VII superfamily nuclease toxin 2 n=1 Tax=Shimia sagamensis TaxID=1566352 RepID=A0ABY1PIZ4_9RHOB|nr:PAAR-like domain-containing protein [Shimia sagamensis]SMP34752.1 GHH signature containing HNH/Endo VII superfamily nuclease toxin 2 [Shimia sagamensis]
MTVFANSLEVSCKAQANKVIAATPDVCMTPPENPATPPGVPVPYPNFGSDGDTDKGTGSVKIGGKTVNQKNSSYFSKTTGDEAGCAAKKGVISSKNTGKAYSQAYSMNVKAEGKNVTRFSDIQTDNHGSPPNTPPWPKIGKPHVPGAPDPCESDKIKMGEACEGETDKASVCEKGGLEDTPGKIETGAGSDALFTGEYSDGGTRHTGSGYDEGTFRDRAGWMERWDKAQANECLAAMRCKLEPYNHGNCCCPGQTGHHLVDAASFNQTGRGESEDGVQVAGLSKRYNPNKAPCICAEGPSATKGSHGALHTETKSFLIKKTGAAGSPTLKKVPFEGGVETKHRSVEYGEFRDQAVQSVDAVFPKSKCSPACIKAQLDAYHKEELGVTDETPLRAELSGKAPEQLNVAKKYTETRHAAMTATA